jgi:hypothetical protein
MVRAREGHGGRARSMCMLVLSLQGKTIGAHAKPSLKLIVVMRARRKHTADFKRARPRDTR